jgi:hypothetical protein
MKALHESQLDQKATAEARYEFKIAAMNSTGVVNADFSIYAIATG